MRTDARRPQDDTLLEGRAALQLYLRKILINTVALQQQGSLLARAVADQTLLLRDLEFACGDPLSSPVEETQISKIQCAHGG
jgi:hypothetical protein